ncbi:MAG: DUF3301 domain-containing protein [Proteobacteria bacterium]|nr:DUF3301 domain-containing protein [Pseudomonadota bacterium]
MLETLLPMVLVLAAFWLWQNALRARERARALARGLCARVGVQLLDETVAVRRVRLRRMPGEGLRLERCYGFEVSVDGADRRHGSLNLLDDEVVSWDLPVVDAAASAAGKVTTGNVIELRPTRTLH